RRDLLSFPTRRSSDLQALGVSANRMLWGSDTFEAAAGPVKGMFDPAKQAASESLKFIILMGLLTKEERDAIMTLIEPIVVGRKRSEEHTSELQSRSDL